MLAMLPVERMAQQKRPEQLSVGFHCVRNFYMRTRIEFMWVNKIEPMYERSRINVKVETGSFFTFTRDLLKHIAPISFTHVKFTCVAHVKITRQLKSALRVKGENIAFFLNFLKKLEGHKY